MSKNTPDPSLGTDNGEKADSEAIEYVPGIAGTEMGRGRQESIREMCKRCICDDAQPYGMLTQVTLCTDWNCPLWDFRPVKTVPVPDSAISCMWPVEYHNPPDWHKNPSGFHTRPRQVRIKGAVKDIVINKR